MEDRTATSENADHEKLVVNWLVATTIPKPSESEAKIWYNIYIKVLLNRICCHFEDILGVKIEYTIKVSDIIKQQLHGKEALIIRFNCIVGDNNLCLAHTNIRDLYATSITNGNLLVCNRVRYTIDLERAEFPYTNVQEAYSKMFTDMLHSISIPAHTLSAIHANKRKQSEPCDQPKEKKSEPQLKKPKLDPASGEKN